MSIFEGLGQQDLAETATDPKRLFRALPKPTGSRFKFPHDIQTEVWDGWYERRDEADLVVKMNTGSGKTAIGLVILKSSLNEGKGPAVYLVPDRQLKAQVEATASELGIHWVDDPYDAQFRQGQAVLIATVHTMYNGLSKFGVRGVQNRSIAVGTVVIDDAHACIPIIEHQFSLLVSRSSPAYLQLFALFADALKGQSLAGYVGLERNEGTQAVPVPYWDWQHHVETSFGVINAIAGEGDSKFVWPLIREQLRLCDVAFSPASVEVRLPYPDLSVVPSYVEAQRRVYMTATLADDSILTTQMGVAPDCVSRPIAPASASDIGDRLILTPIETSRELAPEELRASAASHAQQHNVVVIVPSRHRADAWRELTNEIHDRDSIENVVDRLNSGYVGLVVLIARYDGVDLPNDACRILILDGLPERYSPQELVEAVALGGTDEMDVRQVQRIEQGMGRGVRSTDDYCAVILLDPRLVERLYTASSRDQLSPATRAQYELSLRFSGAGRGRKMDFFDQAISAFLNRDADWVRASKQALEGARYTSPGAVSMMAAAERLAFELAVSGRFEEAKGSFDGAYAGVADARARGWFKQRAAAYLNLVNPVEARALQKSARIDNNYILKIPNEVASSRMSSLGDQATASSGYLSRTYPAGRDLEIGVQSLLRDLTPTSEPNSHKRFEAALAEMGRVIGFSSSRPDQETGIGPDNLWAVGNDRYWCIEAKSESTATQISRDSLEQLSHSADWFEAAYPSTRYSYLPLLVHGSRIPMWDAVPRQGARVLTFERLTEFREAVHGFVTALSIGDGYKNPSVVAANLNQFGLSSGQLEQRWTVAFLPPAARR